MKNKLSFYLAALMTILYALPICAQWTAPTPTPSMLDTESIFYFYNPGAGKFFTSGNAWDTQASIGDKGYRFRVNVIDEGVYTIEDSCEVSRISAWKYLFIDSESGSYVDMASQGNNHFGLTNTEGFNYRITPASESYNLTYNVELYPTHYFGWNGGDNTILVPLLDIHADDAENYELDWQIIEPANYLLYQARLELYKALVVAEEAGISTAAAGAVYTNSSATIEEMQAAAVQLQKQVNEGLFAGATAANPVDVTSMIVNPNFDTSGDVSGWISTTGAQNQTTASNQDGDFTHPFYENWNGSAYTGKVSQQIVGVPNGVYKLKAALFANNAGPLYLFANDDKTVSTSQIPVFVEVFTILAVDTLEIGMMQDEAINNWIGMDTYTLHYYGRGLDAYKLILKQSIDATAAFQDQKIGAEEAAILEEQINLANGVYNDAAISIDEVIVTRGSLEEVIEMAKISAKAYAALDKALTEAEAALNDFGYEPLSDYYMDAIDQYEAASLSVEACYLMVDEIAQLVADAKNNAVEVGDNTRLIINPDFEEGTTGWSTGVVNYSCIEVYSALFDLNQTIKGLPNGKYTVRCQGYFRTLGREDADTQYSAGTDEIRCMLYANGKEAKLMNIMADGSDVNVEGSTYQKVNGQYVPDDMQSARGLMDLGLYDQNEVSVVVTTNELRLGIRLADATDYQYYWMLADNFRLYYHGNDDSVLADELAELLVTAEELANQYMNGGVKLELLNGIEMAKGGENSVMVSISALNDVMPPARTSIVAYKLLGEALADAELRIQGVDASEQVEAAFIETFSSIQTGYESGDFEDEEIEKVIEELNAAVNAYLTGDIVASDDYPVDMTNLIINPDMTDGATGWTGAGTVDASYHVMEQFSKAFETSQTLTGVPNGTYKLSVQAYYRAGLAASAGALRVAGTEPLNALLFANDKTAPIMSIFDDASTEFPLCGTAEEANTWPYDSYVAEFGYVPNSLQGAGIYFDEGMYGANELYVNVVDGTLVIGVKKSELLTDDWVALRSFRLTYYGANSANGIEDTYIADEDMPRSIEYYNIGGARQEGLTKGVNLVREKYFNGKMKVTKVLVK